MRTPPVAVTSGVVVDLAVVVLAWSVVNATTALVVAGTVVVIVETV